MDIYKSYNHTILSNIKSQLMHNLHDNKNNIITLYKKIKKITYYDIDSNDIITHHNRKIFGDIHGKNFHCFRYLCCYRSHLITKNG